MSAILTRASQAYPVAVHSFPLSGLPAANVHVLLTLTRESWPAGIVAVITIQYPNGLGVSMPLTGDSLKDKTGAERTTLSLGIDKPAGVTSALITVDVKQAATTTITVGAI